MPRIIDTIRIDTSTIRGYEGLSKDTTQYPEDATFPITATVSDHRDCFRSPRLFSDHLCCVGLAESAESPSASTSACRAAASSTGSAIGADPSACACDSACSMRWATR